jgi:hypothetical protein
VGTLVYSPGVKIIVDTQNSGTVDLTEDIIQGQLTLVENGMHQFMVQIANHRRKYDKLFTPNDRVVVRMKRVRWVQVYAGYLNQVPLFSAYPGSITLVGSCTLKRLQYLLFDQGATETINLLRLNSGQNTEADGGLRDKAIELLEKIGQWPQGIHFGTVPRDWLTKVNDIATQMEEELAPPEDLLGSGSVFGGGLGGGGDEDGGASIPEVPAGERIFPVAGGADYTNDWGNPRSGGRTHKGTDLFADKGTPLVAIIGGTISKAVNTDSGLGGKSIQLHGTDNASYYYAHCDTVEVNEGDTVTAGQRIGTVGNTGNAATTPPHCHFGIAPNSSYFDEDIAVNPFPILQQIQGNIVSGEASGIGAEMFTYNWYAQGDPESNALTGVRAFMNDQPFLPFIGQLIQSSMRSYCAAPNGDLIAWFPDYFGEFGLAARMIIQNIELMDFTLNWSDELLVTHQYVTGSRSGWGSPAMAAETSLRKFQTAGVATIDFPQILDLLVKPSNDTRTKVFDSAEQFRNRFGARMDARELGQITSAKAEFFYAVYLLQQNWARQFTARVPITFMPELFPGMLMVLADYGVQVYVRQVTHQFSFTDGIGFQTAVTVSAPSSSDGSGRLDLPRAA